MAWVEISPGVMYDNETGQIEDWSGGEVASGIYQPGSGTWLTNTNAGGDWLQGLDFSGFGQDAQNFLSAFDPNVNLASDYTALNLGDWFTQDPTTGAYTLNAGATAPVGTSGRSYLTNTLNRLLGTELTGAEMGLGATGILAALAALTSEPSTTSGTTSQTGTSNQTTSGTTSQQQTGTSSQQQTGTSSQQQSGTSSQEQVGTSSQTQSVSLPDWYEAIVRSAAENLPAKGYEQFGNDMLALPNNRAIADYMNPYMDMVAAPILRRQQEDQARQLQQLAAERVSRGAFGAGRADLLENQMMERQALERDNTLGSLYEKAFGSATGLAQTDLNRAFEDWKLLQAGGAGTLGAAGTTAGILSTLKPGATTTTSGATMGSTTGTTAGTTTGTTAGTTTGTTAGTTTGTTAGTTAGTTGTSGTTSYTGADPNRLGQLAGMAGTIWGMANPNGITGA